MVMGMKSCTIVLRRLNKHIDCIDKVYAGNGAEHNYQFQGMEFQKRTILLQQKDKINLSKRKRHVLEELPL